MLEVFQNTSGTDEGCFSCGKDDGGARWCCAFCIDCCSLCSITIVNLWQRVYHAIHYYSLLFSLITILYYSLLFSLPYHSLLFSLLFSLPYYSLLFTILTTMPFSSPYLYYYHYHYHTIHYYSLLPLPLPLPLNVILSRPQPHL